MDGRRVDQGLSRQRLEPPARPMVVHPSSTRARDRSHGEKPSRWRIALATLGSNLYLVIGSAIFGALAFVTGALPDQGRMSLLMTRLWSRGLLGFSGVPLIIEREADLDPNGRYVFMANHQSLLDIPVLLCSLPHNSRFLAKKSLFRLPIFGWGLKAVRFIAVDRDDRSNAREVFAQAAERLRRGDSILIFPEETRSVDGNLLPFQRGGFLLALKLGVPIVPVGIRGSGRVRGRGSLFVHPSPVEVRYGAPVDVGDRHLRDKRALIGQVRREVGRLAGIEAGSSTESA